MFSLEEAFERVNMPLIVQTIIKDCYAQPYRHYHNIDHISEMLRWLPQDYPEAEIAIEAIIFHDLVYSDAPTAPGLNEALSIAEYLLYNTKALAVNTPFANNRNINFEFERRVIEAINATARHMEDQQFLSPTAKLVLDLDLSTFALPWEDYIQWKKKVESENDVVWLGKYTPEAIKQGRKLFLQGIVKRNRLYYIKTEWEDQARENLRKDIQSYG